LDFAFNNLIREIDSRKKSCDTVDFFLLFHFNAGKKTEAHNCYMIHVLPSFTWFYGITLTENILSIIATNFRKVM
jgi:hypothetical protein